jgi:hypothetical protein
VVAVDLVNWRLKMGIEAGSDPDGMAWAQAK